MIVWLIIIVALFWFAGPVAGLLGIVVWLLLLLIAVTGIGRLS
jgi:hypothetical protein